MIKSARFNGYIINVDCDEFPDRGVHRCHTLTTLNGKPMTGYLEQSAAHPIAEFQPDAACRDECLFLWPAKKVFRQPGADTSRVTAA